MRKPVILLGALLVIAPLLGGCNTAGQPAATVEVRGPSVAFESIDGPPEGVFRRMVSDLDAEARTRQLFVVSRESPAQFRVRGYVSTYIEGKKSAVAWVWDVYDTSEQRTRRFSGEQILAANSGDPWGAMSDEVLHRMASDGMAQLTAYLGGGEAGTATADNAALAYAAAPE